MKPVSFVEGNRPNKLGLPLLLALIVSIPAVVVLGRLQTERLELTQMRQSDHVSLLVAREIASEIGRVLDDYGYAVEALAGHAEARATLNPEVLQKMAAAQRAPFLPFASKMFIADAEGKILAVDPLENQSGVSPGFSIKDRESYLEAVRTGRMVISRPEVEKGSNSPFIQMTAPIRGPEGKLLGLSSGSLDFSSVQPQVAQIISGIPELKMVMIDHEGKLIAGSDKNGAQGMQDLSGVPLFRPTAREREEIRTGADEKGVLARAAVVSIRERGMNWRVIAYRPEAYLRAQISDGKRKLFLLVGAGFAAAMTFMAFAYWLYVKNPWKNRFSAAVQVCFSTASVAGVFLLMGSLAYSQIRFLTAAQIAQVDQEGLLAAKVIARNVGQQIDRSVRVIEALGGQVGAYGNLDPKTLQKIVTTQRTFFPGFTLMYVANAEGFSVAADPPFDKFGMPLAGTDYRDRDYYQAVSRVKKSFVGPVRVGRRSHVPNIQIASPIHDANDRFWAFSEGSVDLLENISPQVEHLIVGIPELTAVVMDKEGRVVAHPEKEARQEIRDLSKLSLFRPSENPEGEVRRETNERAVPVRAAAAPILARELNWRVVVYRPEAFIQAQLTTMQRQTWLMMGIALLPGLLFVILSFRGMKKSTYPEMTSPQYGIR